MNNSLRISYSAAKAWWDGDHDAALQTMLHEDITLPIQFGSQLKRVRAMAFGSGFHKALELESQATGELPSLFGINVEHGVVATELKMTKTLPTGDTVVGVIDAVVIVPDQEMVIICDYKTGLSYTDTQFAVYQYLVHDNPVWIDVVGDFYPTHGMALCLDKATDATHNTILQFSYPKTQDEWDLPDATSFTYAVNWLCTVCEDIRADSLAMAKLGMIV